MPEALKNAYLIKSVQASKEANKLYLDTQSSAIASLPNIVIIEIVIIRSSKWWTSVFEFPGLGTL